MEGLRIQQNGKVTKSNFLRKDIAQEFSVHARDLRPVFALKQVATILPRGNCFILNIGMMKMVIGLEQMYIFNLGDPEVENKFIPEIIERIKTDMGENKFYFFVLELALIYRQQKMIRRLRKLETSTQAVLQKIKKDFGENILEKLLLLKKRISTFETQSKENESAILEILEDDEALAELYLGQSKVENVDEAESILESFLEQLEEMIYKISELKENIDDTQEIESLKLHARRNVIIRFDLLATMVTGGFAFLTVLTGAYGMNIKNNLEKDSSAFLYLNIGMGVFFLLFVIAFVWYFKRKKVI